MDSQYIYKEYLFVDLLLTFIPEIEGKENRSTG